MECPKCNAHIGRFDWGQTCKHCGVNLIYYNLEESLIEDTKKTELSFGKLRVFAAKVKATFIGGPLSIIRLVMLLGCIGLLMIPFASIKIDAALFQSSADINALEIYNAFSNGTFDVLGKITSSVVVGAVAQKAQMLLYAVIALAVVCVLQLVSVIISMVNPRKLSVLTAVFAFLGIGGSIFTAITVNGLVKVASQTGIVSVSSGFGAWASLLGFAVMLALNLIFIIKGVNIKYKDGDLYRAELYKKVKNGEVQLSELPSPVFETEEEKIERLAEIEQMLKEASGQHEEHDEKEEAASDSKQKEDAIHG